MLVGVTVPNIGARGGSERLPRDEMGAQKVPTSMYASLLIFERDVDDNERQFPMMGSVDQIVSKLGAYQAAGLDHIVLAARGLTL
jgi:hypothetical protein